MGSSSLRTSGWAKAWQRSWDNLEERYIPDRELRIGALLDVLEGSAVQKPIVLDLGCGTGTVSCRLLDRFPTARAIAVDVDPVLLTIASVSFAHDDRVRIVKADLRDPAWVDAVPEPQVDAVLTATTLHWLPEGVVRRLYGDLAALVRPAGVVAHAEEMPPTDLPRVPTNLDDDRKDRAGKGTNGTDWDTWWAVAARDPMLRKAAVERRAVFASNYPIEEFSPPADWHIAALRDAGFAEVGEVWRSGMGAVVAAVR